MAEIVGAVASGFTLAGVAVGSARTVFRLKQLWSEVKEVPETIQALMFKVELFESIVLEMEQATEATPILAEDMVNWGGAFARSSEHCQRQLKSLSDLITDLEAAITAQRRFKRGSAKVKVALGGSRLAEFERRMRDVVDILVIGMTSRNMNLMQLNLRQTSSIVRILRDENSDIASGHVLDAETESFDKAIEDKLNQDDSDTESALHWVEKMTVSSEDETTTQHETSVGFKHGIFGGFFVSKKTSGRGLYSKFEYAIQAFAPTWLYGSAFNFQVTRAHGAWAANLRTYNVRPDDSPVFDLALDCDIKGILSMIERKEASVYDIDEYGRGVLHKLFYNIDNDVELALLTSLLAIGADLNQEDRSGKRPMHQWLSNGGPGPEIFEFLHSRGAFDWELTNNYTATYFMWQDKTVRRKATWHARFPDNASKTAIAQLGPTIIALFPYVLTVNEVRELTSTFGHWHPEKMSAILSFWFSMTTGHLITEDATFTEHSQVVVEALQKVERVHEQASRIAKSWKGLYMCRFVAPLGGHYLTPLMTFLTGSWICSCSRVETKTAAAATKTVRHRLMHWLKIIEEVGIPLKEYGKKERLLLLNSPIRMLRWEQVAWRDVWVPGEGWYGGQTIYSSRLKTIPYTAPKLVDIKFGPRPEDWRLIWDMDIEEMAGEFWLMLDDQKPIPGSWDSSWDCDPNNGWHDHSFWSTMPDRDDPRLQGQAYVPVQM